MLGHVILLCFALGGQVQSQATVRDGDELTPLTSLEMHHQILDIRSEMKEEISRLAAAYESRIKTLEDELGKIKADRSTTQKQIGKKHVNSNIGL